MGVSVPIDPSCVGQNEGAGETWLPLFKIYSRILSKKLNCRLIIFNSGE